MNLLIVGAGDKTETILEHLPSSFLLIDDGAIIDALPNFKRRKVTHFDATKHSLNPLQNLTYLRACDFVSIIGAVFPGGENTLTKQYSFIALHEWLDTNPKFLSHFPRAKKDDVGLSDAGMKIRRLLLSPVLKNVLDRPTNFPLKGIVLVRLNLTDLGDFDAFVLGNLIISTYARETKHPVIIPDFGFYGLQSHAALIGQNRLIAGVHFLEEVDRPLKNALLLIEEKVGLRTTAQDAETLAGYMGWHQGKTGYNDFLRGLIT